MVKCSGVRYFCFMELLQIPEFWKLLIFIFFCIVVAVQLFYYLFFFRRLAVYVSPTKQASQQYPISVIVCAKNEAENIVSNLPGILLQDYRTTHEVILVNDNSIDETKYLIEEFQKSFKHLQHLNLKQEAKMIPGKKFPLSMGIRSAKHEVVLLTDADCIPASEHWLYKMQEGYDENVQIVLGYGAYKKKPGLLNKLIRFETFFTALQYFSFALAGKPYMGVGRNLSYKKQLFLNNKGFSAINHIPGGDDDLFISMVANKFNTAIVIDKEAHTVSEPKKTWAQWQKQKDRHYTTSKYYKKGIKAWLGVFSLSQVLIYPAFVAAILFFNWYAVAAIFLLRLIIIAVNWKNTMHKLNEADLWPWFLFFDIWMSAYYLFFTSSLWKKPAKNWD